MSSFLVHTMKTAPREAQPLIEAVEKKYGMVPNLIGIMAEAPSVLKGYLDLSAAIAQGTLSPLEQQVVQITVIRLNECNYCKAAHSKIADMSGLPMDIVRNIVQGKTLTDKKHEALRQFTITVWEKRGKANQADLNTFMEAGYSRAQALEVIANIARKMLSNYAGLLSNPAIDKDFEDYV